MVVAPLSASVRECHVGSTLRGAFHVERLPAAINDVLEVRVAVGAGVREMPVVRPDLHKLRAAAEDDLHTVLRFPVHVPLERDETAPSPPRRLDTVASAS